MRLMVSILLLLVLLSGCRVGEQSRQLTESSEQLSSEQMVGSREPAAAFPQVTATPASLEDPTHVSAVKEGTSASFFPETAVSTIPLSGDIARADAELSGMAWFGDWLILLPQYPTFSGKGADGVIYALPRADILAFLDGQTDSPLEPAEIPLIAPGLNRTIAGYEGFEAIAFDGEHAYLTIEASPAAGMTGHLVKGEIAPDLSALTIDTEKITTVPSATGIANKSDETIVLVGGQVLTIHEANGAKINDSPLAQRFDDDLQPVGTLPFPAVEYRVTDATEVDEDGRFWAINYFFPGEPELMPDSDPLAAAYGQGATHRARAGAERLLEFQLSETGITLVERPPIQLELLPDELRNWEAIVRLGDRGFLLVTDKFPKTILGFVPAS